MPEENIAVLEMIVDAGNAELVQGMLGRLVNYGWEERELEDGRTLFLVYNEHRAFLEELKATFDSLAECRIAEVSKTDWVSSWKEFFTPVECGNHFVVLPPWLAHLEHRTRREIVIDPASAFGTGHHPSTRLCLEALGEALDNGWIKRRGWCLDLGCGTGVLGIAACKLGMDAVALDTDPVAILNARENRELNEATRLEVLKGGIEKVKGEKFDLVMANILAGPLMELAPEIEKSLKKDAVLILGGILATQAEDVEKAYGNVGKTKILHEDEWVALMWRCAD